MVNRRGVVEAMSLRKAWALSFLIAGVVLGLVACSTGSTDGDPQRNAGGFLACRQFHEVTSDVSQGFLTPVELRSKLQKVQSSAFTAEPAIREAAAGLLRAITTGEGPGMGQLTTEMIAACAEHGYSWVKRAE